MDTTHGATCQPTMPMPPLKSPQSPPYLMAFFAAQDSVAKDGGTVSCDPSKITDATKLAACQTYVSFSNYCRLAGGLISAGMSTG